MTATESKSFFRSKFFQIASFIFGPILFSIGISIPTVYLKVIFMVLGFALVVSLYFSRKDYSKLSNEECKVCNGTGSVKIKASMMSEHSIKNCHSYRVGTKTCGMCEGTGFKKKKEE
jgi:predicted membrane protein